MIPIFYIKGTYPMTNIVNENKLLPGGEKSGILSLI